VEAVIAINADVQVADLCAAVRRRTALIWERHRATDLAGSQCPPNHYLDFDVQDATSSHASSTTTHAVDHRYARVESSIPRSSLPLIASDRTVPTTGGLPRRGVAALSVSESCR
jgi:hypothetical protein